VDLPLGDNIILTNKLLTLQGDLIHNLFSDENGKYIYTYKDHEIDLYDYQSNILGRSIVIRDENDNNKEDVCSVIGVANPLV